MVWIQLILYFAWPFSFLLLLLFKKYLFIYLTTPGLSCSMQTLGCSMSDLVFWSGIKPGFPASGVQSLSPWATREILLISFFTESYGCFHKVYAKQAAHKLQVEFESPESTAHLKYCAHKVHYIFIFNNI